MTQRVAAWIDEVKLEARNPKSATNSKDKFGMTKTCVYPSLLLMLMIAGCTGSGAPSEQQSAGQYLSTASRSRRARSASCQPARSRAPRRAAPLPQESTRLRPTSGPCWERTALKFPPTVRRAGSFRRTRRRPRKRCRISLPSTTAKVPSPLKSNRGKMEERISSLRYPDLTFG